MKTEKEITEEYFKLIQLPTNTYTTGMIQALNWVLKDECCKI